MNELEKESNLKVTDTLVDDAEADRARAKFAAAIIKLKKPALTTLHLHMLDLSEHMAGPGSRKAIEVLERTDSAIGSLVADARKVFPDLVVAVVSDHGFAAVTHQVNLMIPFIKAGLITLDKKGEKVVKWEAMPWNAGGSELIVLARPDDAKLKARVARLLKKLASNPAMRIAQYVDAQDASSMGGAKEASFFVDFKIGTCGGENKSGPVVTRSPIKGIHGYFPKNKEMRASFFVTGPSIAKRGSLGEIDMRAIAPTIAKIMGVPFPDYGFAPLSL